MYLSLPAMFLTSSHEFRNKSFWKCFLEKVWENIFVNNTLRQAYYGVNNKSDPELLFLCTMHNVMYINVSEIELK